MGNQSRRRIEAERRKRRTRLLVGLGVTVLVLVAAGLLLRVLSEEEDASGWTLTGVTFDTVRPGDPEAADFEGDGYRVVFDANWEGPSEEPPNRALPCTLVVTDDAGETVHETEFGLYVGTGLRTRTWNPVVIADEDLAALPADATMDCQATDEGGYRLSGIEVVRGWRVTYVPRWAGEGEPVIQACEVQLIRSEDPGSPVFEEPVGLSPTVAGEPQTLLARPDELSLPADDATVECDLEEGEDIIQE